MFKRFNPRPGQGCFCFFLQFWRLSQNRKISCWICSEKCLLKQTLWERLFPTCAHICGFYGRGKQTTQIRSEPIWFKAFLDNLQIHTLQCMKTWDQIISFSGCLNYLSSPRTGAVLSRNCIKRLWNGGFDPKTTSDASDSLSSAPSPSPIF